MPTAITAIPLMAPYSARQTGLRGTSVSIPAPTIRATRRHDEPFRGPEIFKPITRPFGLYDCTLGQRASSRFLAREQRRLLWGVYPIASRSGCDKKETYNTIQLD